MASLNCDAQPKHKCKNCPECQKCQSCWVPPPAPGVPGCYLKHVGHSSARALNKHREALRIARDGAPAGPAASVRRLHEPGSLNEEVLATPITEAIEMAEEGEGAFEAVIEAYGVEHVVTERLGNRKSLLTTESLEQPRLQDNACALIDAVVDRLTADMCDSVEASDKLRSIYFESKNPADERDKLASILADLFVRSDPDDKLLRRHYFAILNASFSQASLQKLLNAALDRGFADKPFIQSRRGHWYKVRTSPESDEEDGDADDVEEHQQISQGAEDNEMSKKLVSGEDELAAFARWPRSKTKVAMARSDFERLAKQQQLLPKWSRSRVAATSVRATYRWLQDHSLGWKGGKTQSVAVGEATLSNTPYLAMALDFSNCFAAYEKDAERNGGMINGAKKVGRTTLRLMFEASTKPIIEKHALSYYFTDGLDALEWIESMLTRIEEIVTLVDRAENPSFWVEMDEIGMSFAQIQELHKGMVSHLKYGMKGCITLGEDACDGNSLHCARFAVGAHCSKNHSITSDCVHCLNFVGYFIFCRQLFNSVHCILERGSEVALDDKKESLKQADLEVRSMLETLKYCGKSLNLFHRHVFRGVWQTQAFRTLLDEVSPGTAVIVIDHKQKIEPVNFRESSAQYYGKKGISLLGAAVIWRTETKGQLFTHYIDTIICQNKQDAYQVQAVIENILLTLQGVMSGIKDVVFVSDNGAALSNKQNLVYIWSRNSNKWNIDVTVSRWLFFESQCGKTILDTHFSFVGMAIRSFARTTRPVSTPQDVYDACINDGGIEATSTVLLDLQRDDGAEGCADGADADAPEDSGKATSVSGIRRTHDVFFLQEGFDLYDFSDAPKASTVKPGDHEKMPKHTFTTIAKHVKESTRALKATSSSSGKVCSIVKSQCIQPLHKVVVEEFETFIANADTTTSTRMVTTPSEIAAQVAQDEPKSSKKKAKMESFLSFKHGWSLSEPREQVALTPELEERLSSMVSSSITFYPQMLIRC